MIRKLEDAAGSSGGLDKVYVPHENLKPATEKMGMLDFHRMCRDMELDHPGFGQPGEVGARAGAVQPELG